MEEIKHITKSSEWVEQYADSLFKFAVSRIGDSETTKEFYDILEKCKRKLNELQSIVFTMKYLDDKNSDEICKELNISSSNYWVLIHRAKLQMRQCLEINWFKK